MEEKANLLASHRRGSLIWSEKAEEFQLTKGITKKRGFIN